MESCEICDRARDPEDVRCSGPCGRAVHARCATFTGITLTTVDGLFWFCDRCRWGLRPVTNANVPPADLPELPTEMWIEIFGNLPAGMLPRVRSVCRRFRGIVDGCPTLLAKITVAFHWIRESCKFKPKHLLPVSRASFIAIKGIGSWWHSYGPGLTVIKIEHFEMERFQRIKLSDLLGLLKHTPNLKQFALIGCILIGKRKGRPDFCLNHLETLILKDIIDLDKYLKIFRKLFCSSPVKTLQITWSDSAGYTAAADPQEMAQIVEDSQTTLEELNVNCSYIFLLEMMFLHHLQLKKLTLTDEGLEDKRELLMELFEIHPTLEHVDLLHMLRFREENGSMLNRIAQLLPKLKFFAIYAKHVDVSFLHKCANLESFQLNGVEENFKLIQSNCFDEKHPNLTQLHLWQVQIPDAFARPWFATLPNLRILELHSCKIASWSHFLSALESLQLLERLTLNLIEACATDSSPPHVPLPRLKRLKFSFCSDLSNDAFGALLAMCSFLRELDLEFTTLDDGMLGAIFRNLHQLRKLFVKGCASAYAMEGYIRQHCRSLEELKFGLD